MTPILQYGFRPFFLGGALWAAFALVAFVGAVSGLLALPSGVDPLFWHRHEMVFGYGAAIIAGFILTAIPNWTERVPVRGVLLAALFGLWLLGRAALMLTAWTGPVAAAAVDGAFLIILTGVALCEIRAGRNWRNLPVCALLALFAAANVVAHVEAMTGAPSDVGVRLGLASLAMLIALIGGRIVPNFTRNWLIKRGETRLPAPFARFDAACLAVALVALAAWVGSPEHRVTGVLLLLAGAAHLARVVRWRGWQTAGEALVLILHVGYLWLPVAFLLMGLDALVHWTAAPASVHALAAGAIGTMTLAVMTRASLGHTGRELTADGPTRAIYAMVVLGATLRVVSPILPVDYVASLLAATVLWGGAFLLFTAVYGPMLLRPRLRTA